MEEDALINVATFYVRFGTADSTVKEDGTAVGSVAHVCAPMSSDFGVKAEPPRWDGDIA